MVNDILEFKQALEPTREALEAKNNVPFFDNKTFLHDNFARYLIDKHHFILLDNTELYCFNGTHYVAINERELNRYIVKELPSLTERKRREVYTALLARAEKRKRADPRYLSLNNGIYNIENNSLQEATPDLIITNHLSVTYDPNATSEILNKFLNDISNNDLEIRKLLEEIVGYALYGKPFMQKFFVFYASGSNGKSAFFELLYQFFGMNNTAQLTLKDIAKDVKVVQLANKMVSIGDDVGAERIKETENLKKLVTGDPILCDRKYLDPLTLVNRATMMFSCNELPSTQDTTHGFYRRLILIPFFNRFSNEAGNLDLNINDKLNDDIVRSHLLNLAIKGLQRVLYNTQFTEPACVKRLLEEYKSESNVVVQFVEEKGIETVIDKKTNHVYKSFKEWLQDNGFKLYSKTYLTKELKKAYGIIAKKTSKRMGGYPKSFTIYTK